MLPNTADLIKCLTLDIFPGFSTCVDFGIQPNSQEMSTKILGALQWAYRNNQTTKDELDKALGNGPLLTEIVNRGKNPYACNIETAWDSIPEEEDD